MKKDQPTNSRDNAAPSNGVERPPYRDVAEDVLKTLHPNARCAFISGSITRGAGTATSDIDLGILYGDDFVDAHRNTIMRDGWLVELFVHNEQSQDYFFDQDIQKGTATMVRMIASSIPIGCDLDFARQRIRRAQDLVDAGPPAWSQSQIDFQRYVISSEMDDLSDPRPHLEQNAILAKLFMAMGEFVRGTKRIWRGSGKHLARQLASECPDIAREFETALSSAHQGDMDKIIALGHKILEPYGGFLQTGYQSTAPDDWKHFNIRNM